MSSTEEDSEMSYDSSCSGDSFIDAKEEENGVLCRLWHFVQAWYGSFQCVW